MYKKTQHQRFLEKFIQGKEDECWNWNGYRAKEGHGTFYFDRKNGMAYRYSYQYYIGELIPGLVIDHQCNNPSCVNPKHLKQMTSKENVLRGVGPGAKNMLKTECPKGHKYTVENTYTVKRKNTGRTFRLCAICSRGHVDEWQSKNKEKYLEKQRENNRKYRLSLLGK